MTPRPSGFQAVADSITGVIVAGGTAYDRATGVIYWTGV